MKYYKYTFKVLNDAYAYKKQMKYYEDLSTFGLHTRLKRKKNWISMLTWCQLAVL